MVFINFSNHPSNIWSKKQLEETRQYGEIIDIHFPNIEPYLNKKDILDMVDDYFKLIISYKDKDEIIVHIMGEMTFCFALIERLKQNNIKCIASTNQRIVNTISSNKKETIFEFCTYREY